MSTLVVKTNAGQATDVLVTDVGVLIPNSGGSATFTGSDEILSFYESSVLRAYVVDDAFGAGSSTLILNDGTSDIAQADAAQWLDNLIVSSSAGAFRVLQTNSLDKITQSIVFDGTATLDSAKLGTDLNADSKKITSLAAPTAGADAANKSYVDSVASGLDIKGSVRALRDSNIAITGDPGTVDGIGSWTTGDRILLTSQTTGSQNGIWVVNTAGAWTRPVDFAAGSSAAGAFTFIEQGTSYGDTGWVCTSNTGSDVVDTDSLAWAQFSSGATNYGLVGDIQPLGGALAAGVLARVARADHVHTHGDRGADPAGAQHDADQVDVEATLARIGAPGTVEAVMAQINTNFGDAKYVGKRHDYSQTVQVPGSGTLYLKAAGGVVSSAVGKRMLRAGSVAGAGLQVGVVDASRAYKLSVKINGVEVASVALPTSTLGAHSVALSGAYAAGARLSVSVERTSGVGGSTFTNIDATVEVNEGA